MGRRHKWLRGVGQCNRRREARNGPGRSRALTGSRAPRAVPRCGRDARRAQSRSTVTRLEFCRIEKYRGSSGVARVSPWHAVEGYGRSSRAHTYAHATAHTHIHDERLRYLGALKCAPPSAPARRRIRKQSPHHAPLLRIAAPSCPFLPPPLPSARLSPPRVERHRRARRRRTANSPHPCRRRSRRGTTRPRTHAGLPHPPLHIILRRRPSPPPGSSARHNTLRMPLRPRPRTHRPRTRRPRSTYCRQQLLLRNLHARHRAQPPPRHLPRLHAARRSFPSRGTAHRGAKVRSPPGGAHGCAPAPRPLNRARRRSAPASISAATTASRTRPAAQSACHHRSALRTCARGTASRALARAYASPQGMAPRRLHVPRTSHTANHLRSAARFAIHLTRALLASRTVRAVLDFTCRAMPATARRTAARSI